MPPSSPARGRRRLHQRVLDIDEAPGLLTLSGDRQRLTLDRLRDEDRITAEGRAAVRRGCRSAGRAGHVVELAYDVQYISPASLLAV